jgi:hypothetical protein
MQPKVLGCHTFSSGTTTAATVEIAFALLLLLLLLPPLLLLSRSNTATLIASYRVLFFITMLSVQIQHLTDCLHQQREQQLLLVHPSTCSHLKLLQWQQ